MTAPKRVLIAEDEALIRLDLSEMLAEEGFEVVGQAADGEQAVALLQGPHGREVRAALMSSWNSDLGPSLIAAMRAVRPDLAVIVLADGGSVALAVDAMRAGASDFLAKPVDAGTLLGCLGGYG